MSDVKSLGRDTEKKLEGNQKLKVCLLQLARVGIGYDV